MIWMNSYRPWCHRRSRCSRWDAEEWLDLLSVCLPAQPYLTVPLSKVRAGLRSTLFGPICFHALFRIIRV